MPTGVARGATVVILLGAMAFTVWLVGAASDLRGLVAGLAFWPLVPYLLLLLVAAGHPTTALGAGASLLAAVTAAGLGIVSYYVAFVRAPAPPGPLVLALIPLVQLCAVGLILGGAFALRRRGADRRG